MFRHKKKSKLEETGESVSSVVHDLADSGADLLDEALAIVSPLVAQASEKAVQLRDLAMQELPPLAEQAKELAAPHLEQASERIAPHLAQASERIAPVAATAAEKLSPALASAREQIGPAAMKARERVVPAATSAVEHLAPLAATAIDRSADLAQQARTQLAPHVQEALERAQPHLEHARQRVQDDLVPHLTDLLHQAAEHPALAEASTRGTAALAALRGDIEVHGSHVVSRRRSRVATLAKVMAAGALLAAAAVAVRQFLASKDEGWQVHQPDTTPRPPAPAAPTPPAAAAATPGNTTVPEPVSVHDSAGGATAEATPIDEDQATSVEAGEARMIAEGGPVVDLEGDEDETLADLTAEGAAESAAYGPGSYVGEQPPEGFAIKGNERSMKYHVPGSGGYDRTIADVWFESEEAAQAGGFTRAQR